MKSAIALFIGITAVLTSPSALAGGGRVGNGGGGVICEGAAPQVLDSYEWDIQGKRILPLERMTRREILLSIEERFRAVFDFPKRGMNDQWARYVQEVFDLFAQAYLSHGSFESWPALKSPPPIFDSAFARDLPPGCRRVPLAVYLLPDAGQRHASETRGQPHRVLPDSALLDEREKRVLELHEAFYAVGFHEFFHWSSSPTRRFLGTLLAETFSKREFRRALLEWDFGRTRPLGFDFQSHDPKIESLKGVFEKKTGPLECPKVFVVERTGARSFFVQWAFPGARAPMELDTSLDRACSVKGNSGNRVLHGTISCRLKSREGERFLRLQGFPETYSGSQSGRLTAELLWPGMSPMKCGYEVNSLLDYRLDDFRENLFED